MKNPSEVALAITRKLLERGIPERQVNTVEPTRVMSYLSGYKPNGPVPKTLITGVSGTGKNWLANQFSGLFPKLKIVDYDKHAAVTDVGWFADNLPDGDVLVVGSDSIKHGLGDLWKPEVVHNIFVPIPTFDAYRHIQALKAKDAPKDSPYIKYWTTASQYADTAVATRMFDGLRTVMKLAHKGTFVHLILTAPDPAKVERGWF